MNDDDPAQLIVTLRAEHRSLDEQIRLLSSEPTGDQQKLKLKDEIQRLLDSSVPDIIA